MVWVTYYERGKISRSSRRINLCRLDGIASMELNRSSAVIFCKYTIMRMESSMINVNKLENSEYSSQKKANCF